MRRKDEEREEARRLRGEGMSVRRIASHLGVAQSSVSVWVRDVPMPPPAPPPASPVPELMPVEDVVEKRCGRCQIDLPLGSFNRAGDGRQHWCRDCFRTYFRKRGQQHRDQSRASREQRREQAQAFLREHLARHPCVDCGEDEILVLEFDHHGDEKVKDVARLLSDRARLEKLEAEVQRCQVVCVNCHRRRSATRAGHYRATGVPAASWTRWQVRNQEHVLDVLRRSGCIDCGEADPVVLDFDHRGEKRGGVTKLAVMCSLEVLEAEIARCDVRCANCHRLRTLAEGACWRAEDHWAVGLHSNP